MKILAIEKEIAVTASKDFQPYLKKEALKVWELQQKDIVRAIYFRADCSTAVLVLECNNASEAKRVL